MLWTVTSLSVILTIYVAQAENLTVTLYYESLCPDCIGFVTDQLFPTYKRIGNDMQLELVPFGNAHMINESGKLQVICQHGPKECYGNEIHACAIALYSVEESAEFVYCSMKSSDPSSNSNLEKCANSCGISWSSLETCYKSGQGDKLIEANGDRTQSLQPPLRFVPTVTFDGQYNQTLEDEALTDLEGVVCKLLDFEPDACKHHFENQIAVHMV